VIAAPQPAAKLRRWISRTHGRKGRIDRMNPTTLGWNSRAGDSRSSRLQWVA
jgi:hypothetical protein